MIESNIYNVLEQVDKLKQHKRKVDLLKAHDNFSFKTIFMGNFADHIDLQMPEGEPPFTPRELEEKVTDERLEKIVWKFKNCNDKSEHQWAREKVFINMLEAVHPDDAKVFIAVKDKNLTKLFPTITKELVKEAYTDIL
tara:strand:- start:245 stop:661 length:417 start_codon:yes stop_codon:yes gene_type:complete